MNIDSTFNGSNADRQIYASVTRAKQSQTIVSIREATRKHAVELILDPSQLCRAAAAFLGQSLSQRLLSCRDPAGGPRLDLGDPRIKLERFGRWVYPQLA